ncbi:hypothetical protein PSW23_04600 [Yersinia pestis]|nr:hypothetical protein [Yersinia pestis]
MLRRVKEPGGTKRTDHWRIGALAHWRIVHWHIVHWHIEHWHIEDECIDYRQDDR